MRVWVFMVYVLRLVLDFLVVWLLLGLVLYCGLRVLSISCGLDVGLGVFCYDVVVVVVC